jgi:hypothetical protein
LQHTVAVAADVGTGWLGVAKFDTGVQVGRFAGLAEADGQSGDLRADMTGVDGQAALRVGRRFIQPVSVQEKIADVGVHLEMARIMAEGAFEGVQGFAGQAQIAVNEAKADRGGVGRGQLVSAGRVGDGLGDVEFARDFRPRCGITGPEPRSRRATAPYTP